MFNMLKCKIKKHAAKLLNGRKLVKLFTRQFKYRLLSRKQKKILKYCIETKNIFTDCTSSIIIYKDLKCKDMLNTEFLLISPRHITKEILFEEHNVKKYI